MKTYVKTFKLAFFSDVENEINAYCRKRNLVPLSISMQMNSMWIYVAVVVTKESEDTE